MLAHAWKVLVLLLCLGSVRRWRIANGVDVSILPTMKWYKSEEKRGERRELVIGNIEKLGRWVVRDLPGFLILPSMFLT